MHLCRAAVALALTLGTAAAGAYASPHSTGAAAGPLFSASYRKDAWLDQLAYIEPGVPEPLTGGRVHVVGVAAASGVAARVYVNGSLVDVSAPGSGDPAAWAFDWLRVEPVPGGLRAGAPFWLSFHSRAAAWDAAAGSGAPIPLRVEDASGSALADGGFVVPAAADDGGGGAAPRVTWVTTAGARSVLLVYWHSSGGGSNATDATLVAARVNGGDVTAALPPSARVVPAGGTVLWQLPAAAVPGGGAAALAPGSVWTVEATWAAANSTTSTAAAGGLLWPEFFPVEAWPYGPDCPFPSLNDSSFASHRQRGLDTLFTEWTLDGGCGHTTLTAADVVNVLAPAHDFYVLPSFEGGVARLAPAINDTTRLAGVFLADEDDTVVDAKARNLLAQVVAARAALPGVPTYAGGASNRYTGAYAGIADVKGMDAYIAACAPHYALLAMPPRGSFDYLANARANHAPGPTWLYTQGFYQGWDSSLDGANRQADAAEVAVQVASVPAAGAKGLMVFSSQLKYVADRLSAPGWATLATLLREVGGLRELYRAGDAAPGMAAALDAAGAPLPDVVAQAILSPRGVVVLLINTASVNGTYNDICCGLDLGACHFTFVPSVVASLTLAPPAGAAVVDAFEVFNASVVPGALPYTAHPPGTHAASSLALANVTLGVDGPGSGAGAPAIAIVRTLVFAFDGALRADVASALAPGGAPAPAVLPPAAAAR